MKIKWTKENTIWPEDHRRTEKYIDGKLSQLSNRDYGFQKNFLSTSKTLDFPNNLKWLL